MEDRNNERTHPPRPPVPQQHKDVAVDFAPRLSSAGEQTAERGAVEDPNSPSSNREVHPTNCPTRTNLHHPPAHEGSRRTLRSQELEASKRKEGVDEAEDEDADDEDADAGSCICAYLMVKENIAGSWLARAIGLPLLVIEEAIRNGRCSALLQQKLLLWLQQENGKAGTAASTRVPERMMRRLRAAVLGAGAHHHMDGSKEDHAQGTSSASPSSSLSSAISHKKVTDEVLMMGGFMAFDEIARERFQLLDGTVGQSVMSIFNNPLTSATAASGAAGGGALEAWGGWFSNVLDYQKGSSSSALLSKTATTTATTAGSTAPPVHVSVLERSASRTYFTAENASAEAAESSAELLAEHAATLDVSAYIETVSPAFQANRLEGGGGASSSSPQRGSHPLQPSSSSSSSSPNIIPLTPADRVSAMVAAGAKEGDTAPPPLPSEVPASWFYAMRAVDEEVGRLPCRRVPAVEVRGGPSSSSSSSWCPVLCSGGHPFLFPCSSTLIRNTAKETPATAECGSRPLLSLPRYWLSPKGQLQRWASPEQEEATESLAPSASAMMMQEVSLSQLHDIGQHFCRHSYAVQLVEDVADMANPSHDPHNGHVSNTSANTTTTTTSNNNNTIIHHHHDSGSSHSGSPNANASSSFTVVDPTTLVWAVEVPSSSSSTSTSSALWCPLFRSMVNPRQTDRFYLSEDGVLEKWAELPSGGDPAAAAGGNRNNNKAMPSPIMKGKPGSSSAKPSRAATGSNTAVAASSAAGRTQKSVSGASGGAAPRLLKTVGRVDKVPVSALHVFAREFLLGPHAGLATTPRTVGKVVVGRTVSAKDEEGALRGSEAKSSPPSSSTTTGGTSPSRGVVVKGSVVKGSGTGPSGTGGMSNPPPPPSSSSSSTHGPDGEGVPPPLPPAPLLRSTMTTTSTTTIHRTPEKNANRNMISPSRAPPPSISTSRAGGGGNNGLAAPPRKIPGPVTVLTFPHQETALEARQAELRSWETEVEQFLLAHVQRRSEEFFEASEQVSALQRQSETVLSSVQHTVNHTLLGGREFVTGFLQVGYLHRRRCHLLELRRRLESTLRVGTTLSTLENWVQLPERDLSEMPKMVDTLLQLELELQPPPSHSSFERDNSNSSNNNGNNDNTGGALALRCASLWPSRLQEVRRMMITLLEGRIAAQLEDGGGGEPSGDTTTTTTTMGMMDPAVDDPTVWTGLTLQLSCWSSGVRLVQQRAVKKLWSESACVLLNQLVDSGELEDEEVSRLLCGGDWDDGDELNPETGPPPKVQAVRIENYGWCPLLRGSSQYCLISQGRKLLIQEGKQKVEWVPVAQLHPAGQAYITRQLEKEKAMKLNPQGGVDHNTAAGNTPSISPSPGQSTGGASASGSRAAGQTEDTEEEKFRKLSRGFSRVSFSLFFSTYSELLSRLRDSFADAALRWSMYLTECVLPVVDTLPDEEEAVGQGREDGAEGAGGGGVRLPQGAPTRTGPGLLAEASRPRHLVRQMTQEYMRDFVRAVETMAQWLLETKQARHTAGGAAVVVVGSAATSSHRPTTTTLRSDEVDRAARATYDLLVSMQQVLDEVDAVVAGARGKRGSSAGGDGDAMMKAHHTATDIMPVLGKVVLPTVTQLVREDIRQIQDGAMDTLRVTLQAEQWSAVDKVHHTHQSHLEVLCSADAEAQRIFTALCVERSLNTARAASVQPSPISSSSSPLPHHSPQKNQKLSYATGSSPNSLVPQRTLAVEEEDVLLHLSTQRMYLPPIASPRTAPSHPLFPQTPTNSTTTSSSPPQMRAGEEGRVVHGALLVLMDLLYRHNEYLAKYPSLAVEIVSGMHKLIELYISLASQLVLDGHAVRQKVLAHITPVHLCVLSQGFALLHGFLPLLQTRLLRLLQLEDVLSPSSKHAPAHAMDLVAAHTTSTGNHTPPPSIAPLSRERRVLLLCLTEQMDELIRTSQSRWKDSLSLVIRIVRSQFGSGKELLVAAPAPSLSSSSSATTATTSAGSLPGSGDAGSPVAKRLGAVQASTTTTTTATAGGVVRASKGTPPPTTIVEWGVKGHDWVMRMLKEVARQLLNIRPILTPSDLHCVVAPLVGDFARRMREVTRLSVTVNSKSDRNATTAGDDTTTTTTTTTTTAANNNNNKNNGDSRVMVVDEDIRNDVILFQANVEKFGYNLMRCTETLTVDDVLQQPDSVVARPTSSSSLSSDVLFNYFFPLPNNATNTSSSSPNNNSLASASP